MAYSVFCCIEVMGSSLSVASSRSGPLVTATNSDFFFFSSLRRRHIAVEMKNKNACIKLYLENVQ